MTDEKKRSKGGTKSRGQEKLDATKARWVAEAEPCDGPTESQPTPENESKDEAEVQAAEGPGFSAEEYRSLRDELPWRDLFPEMPTVEAARQQEDPVFWAK